MDFSIFLAREKTAPSSSIPLSGADPFGKSRSIKDVLARSSSTFGSKFQFMHTSLKRCPTLMFNDSVVSQLAAPFARTLVGKFLLRWPNLDVICMFFLNIKMSGSSHIFLLDHRHFAIHLSIDLDYSRMFLSSPTIFRLTKWDSSSGHQILMSVKNLQLHLCGSPSLIWFFIFNSQILFGLSSILSRPV